jgi:hypothetical protein
MEAESVKHSQKSDILSQWIGILFPRIWVGCLVLALLFVCGALFYRMSWLYFIVAAAACLFFRLLPGELKRQRGTAGSTGAASESASMQKDSIKLADNSDAAIRKAVSEVFGPEYR